MAEVDHDLVKRLAELVDGDAWEMADLLAEKFPPEEYPERDASGRTGLLETLDLHSDALRQDHGVDLKANAMRDYRATAIVWPRAVRTARAAFDAHRRLRGKDRADLMERYLKRNKGQPLSGRHVQRYRSDDKGPGVVLTPEERFEKRVRSTIRSALLGSNKVTGDWWKSPQLDMPTREMAVEVLYRIANDIKDGLDD